MENHTLNLEEFTNRVVERKLSPKQIESFLEVNKVGVQAIARSFELAIEVHKSLSETSKQSIIKMIEVLNIMADSETTEKGREKIIDTIISLSEKIERMDESDKEHSKSMLKIVVDKVCWLVGTVITVFIAINKISNQRKA